ncbi:hypothetical protein GGTG_10252 [Gaeumannomyces tritici R3-111a-1]|uniref:DUF1746 domain-containing protein n=1 Tax=Gaeumannomyces tritici (strain R3-111a-1) TaxID=644352 RepID=J3P9S7_GAET3|nr:hypothetical protein GGTG_10252 [Gaeumannomyces tritici R3-111a-1]EJT73413.1 hypothetical protein GGTG_10252 [Gaeumannomyces tritici R3-111a-1]
MNHDDAAAGSSSQGTGPSGLVTDRDPAQDSDPPLPSPPESAAQRRKAGMYRKFLFMTHLMTNLDALVYAEICALYYMDCSFFRLLMRVLVQSFFLSPKSDEFVLLMPTHRPHVVAVLAPNLLCMLLHLLTSLPTAGESTRGYLHGGVIIDFVGEKAPTSKFKLLLLDMLVLALQCTMLAVHAERERLRKVVKPAGRVLGTTAQNGEDSEAAATSPTTPVAADNDTTERAFSRTAPRASRAGDGIELQPLPPRRDAQPAQVSAHRRRPPDLREYMLSGNAVLGDFHVLHALRTASNDYQSATAQSLQSIGYATTLARLVAEPRSRLIRLRAQRREQQQQQQQQGGGMV